MALTIEPWMLAAGALVAAFLLILGLALWRWARARRELSRAREQVALLVHDNRQLVAEREAARNRAHEVELGHREQLAALESELRGRSVQLEQLQQQLRDRSAELAQARSAGEQVWGELSRARQEQTLLQTQLSEREDRHQHDLKLLNETRESLKKDFESLANRIFEDKGRSFTATSQASLEALLKPFREQISGFQARINEVHDKALQGNTALEKEIQKVLDIGLQMNTQASNLTQALKGDKKTAGNWGEAQLQRTLELAGLQAGEHYETQTSYRDEDGRRKLPDFLIKLPDKKNIVIDSKVSLVDYDRAIAADTDQERDEALNAHALAVRNHIDDLSSKDYANLPGIGSPNFVLMFMPVEPAYIEAMKHNRDLFNYGYQRGVVMVSHTTLMPILRTVANLWMIEQSNQQAREISSSAGDIYNQVCRMAERLEKLGNSMRAAQGHYNDTLTSLVGRQGLYGKVERFQQLSTRAIKDLPALEAIGDELETDRLAGSDATPTPLESSTAPDRAAEPPSGTAPGSVPGAANVKPIKPETGG